MSGTDNIILSSLIAIIVRKLVCTTVAKDRKLTSQRFLLLICPAVIIHAVTQAAKAHIQVTVLESRVDSQE